MRENFTSRLFSLPFMPSAIFKAVYQGVFQSEHRIPYCILAIAFILNIAIMWPGQMSPDSYTQYDAAIKGVFDDHHPPIMSLLWGFLDYVYKGPGLLFLFHILMLYGASLIFMMSVRTRAVKILYALFPLFPQVLLYSSMIWKDVGCAFSLLLACAILYFYSTPQKKLSLLGFTIIMMLVFYGAAVKFQGQYVAPLIIFGAWYYARPECFAKQNVTKDRGIYFHTLIKTIFSCIFFFFALQSFNDYFVPLLHKAHSWQCVKIYDLAAISIALETPLMPDFILACPDFSLQRIKERFNHKRVDDLFFPPNNPVRLGKNEQEREALLMCWHTAVWNNFGLYMRHRFANWWTMVNNMPLQRFDTMDFKQFGGLSWFVALQEASQQRKQNTVKEKVFHYTGGALLGFLSGMRYLFKFAFLLPFILIYFIIGWALSPRDPRAMVLMVMNGISLLFLAVLFFCSMASDMRYVYIAACMTHASHGIAVALWKDKKINKSAVANKG